MLFDDTYRTIAEPGEGIFKDKGSKFLAFGYPIKSEADIKQIVTNLKTDHPKAAHCCWALRFSTDRSVFRINDDGEPSGTAGRPILNTLLSYNLTNVAVVVVRYFGGTLLGVPGLIDAYKSATEDFIKSAKIIEKSVTDSYGITFDYSQMNEVMSLLKSENLAISHQQFDTVCQLQVEIRKSRVEKVISLLQATRSVKVFFLSAI